MPKLPPAAPDASPEAPQKAKLEAVKKAAKAARDEEEKLAAGWLHTAQFLTTAAQLHHLPPHSLPEIAFVGRSNAGKSTCINTLTQQKRLAFASKTPGRTQHINLFSLGRGGVHDAALADLPGYGYAAVPKDAKYRWQRVMASYLASREQLVGVVVLCDSRHGITDIDEALLELLRPRVEQGLKFVVALTKADKLNRAEGVKALSIAKLQSGGGDAMLISASSKTGIGALGLRLRQWVDSADVVLSGPAAQGAFDGDDEPEELPG